MDDISIDSVQDITQTQSGFGLQEFSDLDNGYDEDDMDDDVPAGGLIETPEIPSVLNESVTMKPLVEMTNEAPVQNTSSLMQSANVDTNTSSSTEEVAPNGIPLVTMTPEG